MNPHQNMTPPTVLPSTEAIALVIVGILLSVLLPLAVSAIKKAGLEEAPSRPSFFARVSDAWKRFYTSPQPPFSWEPAEVVVLESGMLALSTGPVRDPQGKLIATFTSIWRLEAPGTWRIVFDKGNDVCDCAPKSGG